MTIKEIVLAWSSPVRVYLSKTSLYPNEILIDGRPCIGTWPPWPTSPDILAVVKSSSFVGVTFTVPSDSAKQVHRLCSQCDPRVVRFIPPERLLETGRYQRFNNVFPQLEIVWANEEPDAVITAQLPNDLWYHPVGGGSLRKAANLWYSRVGGDNIGADLVAFGLHDVDEVLRDFKLSLPDFAQFERLDLPQLPPSERSPT